MVKVVFKTLRSKLFQFLHVPFCSCSDNRSVKEIPSDVPSLACNLVWHCDPAASDTHISGVPPTGAHAEALLTAPLAGAWPDPDGQYSIKSKSDAGAM